MPWLVRGGEVLASAETATTRRARRVGLLGRDGVDGVLVVPARSVHTFGMRFPIDVAVCDRDLRVRRIVTLPRNRITRPTWRRSVAIEASAGAFRSWGVAPGDRLELR
jgi:uncharacterized protein